MASLWVRRVAKDGDFVRFTKEFIDYLRTPEGDSFEGYRYTNYAKGGGEVRVVKVGKAYTIDSDGNRIYMISYSTSTSLFKTNFLNTIVVREGLYRTHPTNKSLIPIFDVFEPEKKDESSVSQTITSETTPNQDDYSLLLYCSCTTPVLKENYAGGSTFQFCTICGKERK